MNEKNLNIEYDSPTLELVFFDSTDVIKTSNRTGCPNDDS